MFTFRGTTIIVHHETLVPSDADPSKLVTVAEHYGMTDEEVASANMEMIRNERNRLLAETDWVSGSDVPQNIKDKWYPYRQELRDITKIYSIYNDVVWPTKP